MANIKQQKKRIITDAKKRINNRSFTSQVKKALIAAHNAITKKAKNAKEMVIKAQKLLDKTLTKKIKKPNNVARKKSQLHKKLNSVTKKT